MHEVLALRDVTMTDARGVTALAGVDLTIAAGEMVAVVGPPGAGTSALLRLMGAHERPTEGVVRVVGHDVATLSDRRVSALRAGALGFVFPRSHLLDALSALDNVATALVGTRVPRHLRGTLARRALERVGLGRRLDHRPGELSGGERQRVAIARAIVRGPALVLAHEPTGALDGATGRAVLDLVVELHGQGTTIALVTHDPDVAARLPRRVELREGRVVADMGAEAAVASA